jgi:hypothetical protein
MLVQTLSFLVLNSCVGDGYPAEGVALVDTTVLFCKTSLDPDETRVCPLVDSFAVCLRRDCKQVRFKIHDDGALHLGAMTCSVQDIIALGLRAVWG